MTHTMGYLKKKIFIFVEVSDQIRSVASVTSDPLDYSLPGYSVHGILLSFDLSQHQGLFLVSQLFASGGQSIGISVLASVLPMNIQD